MLQHQPIINLLRGRGTAFLIASLEPSTGLSSYVAYSYKGAKGCNRFKEGREGWMSRPLHSLWIRREDAEVG
jgi:hypothetical protein